MPVTVISFRSLASLLKDNSVWM